MALTYFKRYRMEFDLADIPSAVPPLPAGYDCLPWNDDLLDAHAEVKYHSFRFELDANVFPCLGERDGCRRLMSDIACRGGFVPEATWLLAHVRPGLSRPEYCGTIQGITDGGRFGSIQNVGILVPHRGLGLGTCLLYRALDGFRRAGLDRAYLEVTAQNTGAIRLYHRVGFRTVKTVYKAAEVAYA
jgi:GNAT superfamily N-acetyltransferase